MGFWLLHIIIWSKFLWEIIGFSSCFYKSNKYSININKYNNNKVSIYSHHKIFSTKGPDMNWDPKIAPKLDFTEDYYKVLEIPHTIPQKDLKKSYYKLVFRYHPDNKRTDQEKELSNKQMMVINNAYKILKDENLRSKYDIQRQNGLFGSNAKVKTATVNNSDPTSYSSTTSNSKDTKNSQSTKTTADTKARTSNNYNNNNNNNNVEFDEDKMWETFRGYASNPKDNMNNDYNSNKQSNQNQRVSDEQEQPVESFGDLLSDMWSDGGRHFVTDLLEFLETQTPLSSVTANIMNGGVNGGVYGFSSAADRESEINMLQNTIKSLEIHIQDLTKERSNLSITGGVSNAINSVNIGTSTTQQQLEERLRLLESARGLDARIFEAKKQMRQLQDKLRRSLATSVSTSSGYSGNNNNNNEKSNSGSNANTASSKRNVIDDDMADNYSSSYYKTDTKTDTSSSSSSQQNNNGSNNKSTSSSTQNPTTTSQQQPPSSSSSSGGSRKNNNSSSNTIVNDSKAMRELLVEDELKKLKLKLKK